MQRTLRMKKELERLLKAPPPGVTVWPDSDSDRADRLTASISGPEDTPYSGGHFLLDVTVPERYPFEPPQVSFRTRVYHPNVDADGRICLDLLKTQPKGDWKPSRDIASVLTSIRLLLAEPNPDDPLMADIAYEYRHAPSTFDFKAREMTERHAKEDSAKKRKKEGGDDDDDDDDERGKQAKV